MDFIFGIVFGVLGRAAFEVIRDKKEADKNAADTPNHIRSDKDNN